LTVGVKSKAKGDIVDVYPVMVNLPEEIYRQIQRAAERLQRPMDDVLAEAVSAVAPVMDVAPGALRTSLAQLAYMNDAALWQAARSTLTLAQRERLADLHTQQQDRGLTSAEKVEEAELLQRYKETQLVRAQAVVLLHQRGYDTEDPSQFHPLD